MLILILKNVNYLQNIVSSFQEDPNGQNHSLKNSGEGSTYKPPKFQRVEIFSSESTSYLNL